MKCLRFAALLSAVGILIGTGLASATVPSPPTNPVQGLHCESALPLSGSGPWGCADEYTRGGITVHFGQPGFDPGTAAAPQPHNESRINQARPATSARTLTHTYQDNSSTLWDYGYYQNNQEIYVGTIRATGHMNLNGRQTQTNLSTFVTEGPPIAPTGAWSSGCGGNSAGASNYTQSWSGPTQTGYCNYDTSYRATYKFSWYAAGYSYYWNADTGTGITSVSSQWTCSAIFAPQTCYFGN